MSSCVFVFRFSAESAITDTLVVSNYTTIVPSLQSLMLMIPLPPYRQKDLYLSSHWKIRFTIGGETWNLYCLRLLLFTIWENGYCKKITANFNTRVLLGFALCFQIIDANIWVLFTKSGKHFVWTLIPIYCNLTFIEFCSINRLNSKCACKNRIKMLNDE